MLGVEKDKGVYQQLIFLGSGIRTNMGHQGASKLGIVLVCTGPGPLTNYITSGSKLSFKLSSTEL